MALLLGSHLPMFSELIGFRHFRLLPKTLLGPYKARLKIIPQPQAYLSGWTVNSEVPKLANRISTYPVGLIREIFNICGCRQLFIWRRIGNEHVLNGSRLTLGIGLLLNYVIAARVNTLRISRVGLSFVLILIVQVIIKRQRPTIAQIIEVSSRHPHIEFW